MRTNGCVSWVSCRGWTEYGGRGGERALYRLMGFLFFRFFTLWMFVCLVLVLFFLLLGCFSVLFFSIFKGIFSLYSSFIYWFGLSTYVITHSQKHKVTHIITHTQTQTYIYMYVCIPNSLSFLLFGCPFSSFLLYSFLCLSYHLHFLPDLNHPFSKRVIKMNTAKIYVPIVIINHMILF